MTFHKTNLNYGAANVLNATGVIEYFSDNLFNSFKLIIRISAPYGWHALKVARPTKENHSDILVSSRYSDGHVLEY